MTGLSEGRISHLSHLILDALKKDDLINFLNESKVLRETKEVLSEVFNLKDRLDQLVRQKIQSLSRPVTPGSREWEVLYRKYLEEELNKQRA